MPTRSTIGRATGAGLIWIILAAGMLAFASGRMRHDFVAAAMLVAALATGVVPAAAAFEGFADPVVATVGCVMALSAAIARSGVLGLAIQPFRGFMRKESGLTAVFCLLCALTSAFMNNVGAIALLMPAALDACRSASVSPSRVLMPMAFASLLGGLVTLIGTPPNVLIGEIRADFTGASFRLFDFAPVGLIVAIAGISLMLLLVRLLPERASAKGEPLLFQVADYLFEVRLPANADPVTVQQLLDAAPDGDSLTVHAIDRRGLLITSPETTTPLRAGDVVQLEGRAPIVQGAIARFGLEVVGGVDDDRLEAALLECVVNTRSSLIGQPDGRARLAGAGAALLAASRSGRAVVEGLDRFQIAAGDILLLQAPDALKLELVDRFNLLPLAERAIKVGAGRVDWRPLAALVAAIVATMAGLPLAVALLSALTGLALVSRRTARFYRDIDWSIIVLLAALLPIAEAFSTSGAGNLVANALGAVGASAPPLLIIGATLAAAMLITPFLNNAATVVLLAPVAAAIGQDIGVSIDALLMAVAVGASCDFLTPIGHQSNTLVMGPGGYRFLDYPRLGAPLSMLVLIVGTLAVFWFWA